jgi:hypothetical protein
LLYICVYLQIEETELELRRQFLELCQWITSLEVSCQGQQQHNSDATKDEETAPVEEQLWEPEDYEIPPHCIPIRCDVREAPWDRLTQLVDNFDAIMMDPPWQLATANPTRGVALGYNQLSDECIASLPIHKLQRNGFMFIWVINAKYRTALHLFQRWVSSYHSSDMLSEYVVIVYSRVIDWWMILVG